MLTGLGSLVLIDMVAFNHSRLVIHWISGPIDVLGVLTWALRKHTESCWPNAGMIR